MAEGHAPRLADGGFSAGHGDVVEMGETLEMVEAADEHFPAPDAAVGAVTGAVEGDADSLGLDCMFGHASGDVSVMMLHSDDAQAAFAGPLPGTFGGEIAGMKIVDNRLGLDLKGAHQVVERIAKEAESGEIFKIAKMLALIDEATAGEGKYIFEMAADSEEGRGFEGQRYTERDEAAGTADDLRSAIDDGCD